MDKVKSVTPGQAVYNPWTLKLYDWWVLGVSNHKLWRCPTSQLETHFHDNVSDNHLDVGVGTGYYLKHALPHIAPRLALMDLNKASLDKAKSNIRHLNPEIYQANILAPIDFDGDKFDSISLNYLLHCLPGTIEQKSQAFTHLKPLLNQGGVVFGSTILGAGVEMNWFAKKLMAIYNKKGIFDNYQDSFQQLKQQLELHFNQVEIKQVGIVAIFKAKNI